MRHDTVADARRRIILEHMNHGIRNPRLYDSSKTEWNNERNGLVNGIAQAYNDETIDLPQTIKLLDIVYNDIAELWG